MAAKRRRQNKRQRRQARQAAHHDLRQRYREHDLPFQNGVAAAIFEDAYAPAGYVDAEGNLDARARLKQIRHSDGSIAEGAPGWTPPQRPLITAIALKDDPRFKHAPIQDAAYENLLKSRRGAASPHR